MLAADGDDMVVKAMSWALRELAKRDPRAVRDFLAAQPVAARVAREVRNKLTTGLKNPHGKTQGKRQKAKVGRRRAALTFASCLLPWLSRCLFRFQY